MTIENLRAKTWARRDPGVVAARSGSPRIQNIVPTIPDISVPKKTNLKAPAGAARMMACPRTPSSGPIIRSRRVLPLPPR